MCKQLSPLQQAHLSSNKGFCADDFYHNADGSINEDAIHAAAQRHIDMLRSFVPEKTLRELRQALKICLSWQDWHSVTFCLSTYLGIAAEWLEKYVLRLTADKQAIQCYAERIELLLSEGKDIDHVSQHI